MSLGCPCILMQDLNLCPLAAERSSGALGASGKTSERPIAPCLSSSILEISEVLVKWRGVDYITIIQEQYPTALA